WVQSAVSAGTDLAIQGNVGIGTTAPGNILEVSAATPRLMVRVPTESTAYDAYMAFYTGSGAPLSTNFVSGIKGIITQANPSALKGDLALYVNAGDSVSEAVRIQSTGNVGIGTTAPNSTLHVVGIVNATQGFAYGLSAARPAAKEGVVWWNVSAGFHCPQWYNSTHWICNTGAATRADPV
ncbi:MAG: hypothetical protein COZ52_00940, partial [Candidatus Aenigmarchaeota archaeon CG_4_8_14_3_um_filter_37_24]